VIAHSLPPIHAIAEATAAQVNLESPW